MDRQCAHLVITHACCLDSICDLDEKLLVFRLVLPSDEHLNGESASLDLVKILGCLRISVNSPNDSGLG